MRAPAKSDGMPWCCCMRNCSSMRAISAGESDEPAGWYCEAHSVEARDDVSDDLERHTLLRTHPCHP